jgi:hypothetical protein
MDNKSQLVDILLNNSEAMSTRTLQISSLIEINGEKPSFIEESDHLLAKSIRANPKHKPNTARPVIASKSSIFGAFLNFCSSSMSQGGNLLLVND